MGTITGISWTDHTFNKWWGCTKVTSACKFCYAETLAKRTGRIPEGYVKGGSRVLIKSANLSLLNKWNKLAIADKRKHLVFAHSMSDVFDMEVSNEWRADEFKLFKTQPNLIYQILTKRPKFVKTYLEFGYESYPVEQTWLGTSLGSDADIDMAYQLMESPAKVHWISYEPAIGRLSVNKLPKGIDWIVIGGESGAGCRPFDLKWAFEVIEECKYLGIKVFMKQVGGNPFYDGKKWISRYGELGSHGKDPETWPNPLRVREFPEDLKL